MTESERLDHFREGGGREISMKRNTENTDNAANILEVHNAKSAVNSYYDMSTPIQFTLSYCSGLTSEDHFNIMMVSPRATYFHTSAIDSLFHRFNARSLHYHSFFELVIVLEGCITQRIEDKDYFYPAGTCCLINQNVLHVERYTGEAKILFLGFSTAFIKELLEAYKIAYFPKEETAYENSIFRFMAENIHLEKGKNYLDFLPVYQNQSSISDLHKLADQLLHAMLCPKLGSTYMIKGLVCNLFQYLDTTECYHISDVKLNSDSDFVLFSRISHLMEDTNGRMSRSDLERVLCYSGNYMNTIVKKRTGMCLYDYGLTFTLKKAAALLADTTASISSIAIQMGFSNRTHFYKVFRDKYGLTPGEYRERHRRQPVNTMPLTEKA